MGFCGMLHFNIIRNPKLVLVSLSCTITALECPSAPVFDFLQMQVLIKVLTPTFALFTDLKPKLHVLAIQDLEVQMPTRNHEPRIENTKSARGKNVVTAPCVALHCKPFPRLAPHAYTAEACKTEFTFAGDGQGMSGTVFSRLLPGFYSFQKLNPTVHPPLWEFLNIRYYGTVAQQPRTKPRNTKHGNVLYINPETRMQLLCLAPRRAVKAVVVEVLGGCSGSGSASASASASVVLVQVLVLLSISPTASTSNSSSSNSSSRRSRSRLAVVSCSSVTVTVAIAE